MNNLIIIGNGFDLAHGLKTRYDQFIDYLITSEEGISGKHKDLFEYYQIKEFDKETLFPEYLDFKIKTKNSLFSSIISGRGSNDPNWSDIETVFYEHLKRTISKDNIQMRDNILRLNSELDIIKNYLEDYLLVKTQQIDLLGTYEHYLDTFKSNNSLILSFNYTKTLDNYLAPKKYKYKIDIHGRLKNVANPIIFGYAANVEESRELQIKENNHLLRNIKRYNYNRTANETILQSFLENTKNVNVHILGHSCGTSDKHILSEIFNHKNTKSITPFYYDTYDNYFDLQTNIDRIMDNPDNFKKVVNFQDCIRMPQYDETNDKTDEFVELVNNLRNKENSSSNDYMPITVALRAISKKDRY